MNYFANLSWIQAWGFLEFFFLKFNSFSDQFYIWLRIQMWFLRVLSIIPNLHHQKKKKKNARDARLYIIFDFEFKNNNRITKNFSLRNERRRDFCILHYIFSIQWAIDINLFWTLSISILEKVSNQLPLVISNVNF